MKSKTMKKQLISIGICLLMLASASIVLAGTAAAANSWPMLRYDTSNTGSTTGAPELQNELWISDDIDPKKNAPTVYGGYVYVFKNLHPRGVVRFDVATGEHDEDFFISLSSIPSIGAITFGNGGKLYFGSSTRMYCYDTNGNQLWQKTLGGTVGGTATVADGKVFVGSGDKKMNCLDADDGDIIWTYAGLPTEEKDPPAIDSTNDHLYFGSGDTLYCLDAIGDGMGGTTSLWTMSFTDENVKGPVVLYNEWVFYVSDRIYKLNSTGSPFGWSNSIDGSVTTSLLFADGKGYVGTTNGYLYCYDLLGNLVLKWEKDLHPEEGGFTIPLTAAEVDGEIYIPINQGIVYCLNANNQGDIIWQYDTEDAIESESPAIAGQRVFISGKNYLFAIGGPNQKPPQPDMPVGPTRGRVNIKHHFTVNNTADPDGQDLYYNFNWDDGTESGWIGPFKSGKDVEVPAWHKYEVPGDYQVRVKAKDSLDAESPWSEPLDVHIDYLEVHNVQGGFGVTCDIKNVGDYAKDIDWTVELVGGQITGLHIFRSFEGTIEPLNAGESQTVTASPVFGLGNFKVIVTAKCVGEEVEETFDAFALFFYVMIR
jgi:outer membrane protein assembly factor BamB